MIVLSSCRCANRDTQDELMNELDWRTQSLKINKALKIPFRDTRRLEALNRPQECLIRLEWRREW